MAEKEVAPYGLWTSPITPSLLSGSSIAIEEVLVDESNRKIYWIESRPTEDGRYTIVQHTLEGGSREILPKQYSAHATVNESGGGSFALDTDGTIVFSDDSTQHVLRLDPESCETKTILEPDSGLRYGDYNIHPIDKRWILAVREDHRQATPATQAHDVHNILVAIDASSHTEQVIAKGADFYSYPRFNRDGTRVCWIEWFHPDMPWTGTILYTADWNDGKLNDVTRVTGEKMKESVSQPSWGPSGELFYASDKTGYWQLYSFDCTTRSERHFIFKGLEQAEFAIADWMLADTTYAFLDSQTIVASCVTNATSDIVKLDLRTGTHHRLNLPYLDLANCENGLFRVSDASIVVLGSTATATKRLSLVTNIHSSSSTSTNPPTAITETVLKSILNIDLPPSFISQAQSLTAPRTHRPGKIHLFYFPPQNGNYTGPPDTPPPGIIQLHGGPNGCSTPALDLDIQFWTSRGYAVASINYSGSAGFGRSYREELTGHWGIYDVQDTADSVRFLISQNLISGQHVGVYGGSAGGYGTLSAISMFPDMFTAAVSLYGISDVSALMGDSYKFESQDVERMLLSCCARDDHEARGQVLKQRSPLFHAEKITAPLLILQGTEDVVVPPAQSHRMVEEIERQGRTVKIVEFEGEGHGWIMERNIKRSYEEMEMWFRKYLCEDGGAATAAS